MGSYAALAHTTWVSGYDMTGDTNGTSLDITYDELMATVFGNTGQQRTAGLENVEASVKGPWDSGTTGLDPTAFVGLGTTVETITQTPSGTELDVAWIYQAKRFSYKIGGTIGEVLPYEMNIKGTKGAGLASVGAVRGRLLKAKGAVAATGAIGTGYQLGAVATGQYLYGTFHVFAAGTTITAVLESDDNAGFSSATTRATVGPITAIGGTWATRVAGPITDDYYRWRITAITGSFTIAATAGIK